MKTRTSENLERMKVTIDSVASAIPPGECRIMSRPSEEGSLSNTSMNPSISSSLIIIIWGGIGNGNGLAVQRLA